MDAKKFSREIKKQSPGDLAQFEAMEKVFSLGGETLCDKIDAFPKYATRQSIAKFLTKYEIFKKILSVNGSIVECGVLHGAGLMAWAKLSSILEPVNHTRRIYGFDTFEGFTSITDKDTKTGESIHFGEGRMEGSSYEELLKVVELYDTNRPLNHIPKVELVKGDLSRTASQFLETHPHLVVSLLYLDVVIYEPTKAALKAFLPRMGKGSIIVFDELNADVYPGETMAVHDAIGLNNLRIERFPFDSYVSYAVLE